MIYLHIISKAPFKLSFLPSNLERGYIKQVKSDLALCVCVSNSKLNLYHCFFSLQYQSYFDVVIAVILAVVPNKYCLPQTQFRKPFETQGLFILYCGFLYEHTVICRTCCLKWVLRYINVCLNTSRIVDLQLMCKT